MASDNEQHRDQHNGTVDIHNCANPDGRGRLQDNRTSPLACSTIYMGFVSPGTNLFNTPVVSSPDTNTVGEAPQLSPTYGEYDNGAVVFPVLYSNFPGPGLPASFTSLGNGAGTFTQTVSDGLTLTTGTAIWGGVVTTNQYSTTTPMTFEADVNDVGGVAAGFGGTAREHRGERRLRIQRLVHHRHRRDEQRTELQLDNDRRAGPVHRRGGRQLQHGRDKGRIVGHRQHGALLRQLRGGPRHHVDLRLPGERVLLYRGMGLERGLHHNPAVGAPHGERPPRDNALCGSRISHAYHPRTR